MQKFEEMCAVWVGTSEHLGETESFHAVLTEGYRWDGDLKRVVVRGLV